MTNQKRYGWIWVLVCAGVTILWGTSIARHGNAWVDFRAVYAGTRCLIHHHNPYSVGDITREYASEDGLRPPPLPAYIEAVTLYVNVPTTFLVVAPFALLSWGPAHILWMLLTGCAFTLALLLMWSVGTRFSPRVAACLACFLAIDSEALYAGGNTAGLVVGLCGIAVWCFLENRWARLGIVCLAIALAVKPHDAGMVWLYFLLAGGVNRRRALHSLLIVAVMGVVSAAWLSQVAPSWMHDWKTNLTTISATGGINDPSPGSFSGRTDFAVVDLQAAISVFRNDPRLYNPLTYLICGAFLLAWMFWTLRAGFSEPRAWLALPVAVAFSMLITYHRPWDSNLVMVAIPACAMLWSRRDRVGQVALAITTAATLFTGAFPLASLAVASKSLHLADTGLGSRLLILVLNRPESLALLALGIFYLCIYVREAGARRQNAQRETLATLAGS